MHESDYIEEQAAKLIGNWKRFGSFGWHDRPEDDDNWAIVYTHTRDSSLLEQSNAAVIAKTMERFCNEDNDDSDCKEEHH